MRIGITYDLRKDYIAAGFGEEETAEFDSEDTIETLDKALQDLGFKTERVGNVKNLVAVLAQGKRWDLVFNIAEGLKGFGREAQVPALLEAFDITYTFSDPLVLALTLHKGMVKRVVRDHGIPTPDFTVVEEVSDIKSIDMPFPLFAKPIAEGTGKGINALSKIKSPAKLSSVCIKLLKSYNQPVLVESFLPGREFTVGILGTGKDAIAIGAMEVIIRENAEQDVYSYVNKENCEKNIIYRLAMDAETQKAREIALEAWRALGCRDAGRVDLRSDANGNPNFLEINPLAGLNHKHSDLPILCSLVGIDYQELIGLIIESAVKRLPANKTSNYSKAPVEFEKRVS